MAAMNTKDTKNTIIVLFVSCLLLASTPVLAKPLDVFVSLLPQKWLVEQIGGELVSVHVLVDKGQEPHNFLPVPKQITALFRARIYFTLDMNFEREIVRKIKPSAQTVQIINIVSGIHKIPINSVKNIVGQGNNQDYAGEDGLDPHVWLDPKNLLVMADNIARALSAADPQNQDVYEKNLEQAAAMLNGLNNNLQKQLAPYHGATFFVFHPAFGYFANAFGLQQRAVEAGGKSPGPKQLRALIRQARLENVKIIFVQPQFDHKSAEAIARAIGGEVVPLDPLAENVGENLRLMGQEIESALHGQ